MASSNNSQNKRQSTVIGTLAKVAVVGAIVAAKVGHDMYSKYKEKQAQSA